MGSLTDCYDMAIANDLTCTVVRYASDSINIDSFLLTVPSLTQS
jgi:hypothetical protein